MSTACAARDNDNKPETLVAWTPEGVDAGLGKTREEILERIAASAQRADENSQRARSQAISVQIPTVNQYHSKILTKAKEADQAASDAMAAIKAALTVADLPLLREMERKTLRAETRTYAAAQAVDFYANPENHGMEFGEIP